MSAYTVEVPVGDWPVMPPQASGGGRRYIPVGETSDADWTNATQWAGIPMVGPLRYGEVHLDAQGRLERCEIPPAPQHPEEQEDDGTG